VKFQIDENYFFNSSGNIEMDKVLTVKSEAMNISEGKDHFNERKEKRQI